MTERGKHEKYYEIGVLFVGNVSRMNGAAIKNKYYKWCSTQININYYINGAQTTESQQKSNLLSYSFGIAFHMREGIRSDLVI